MFEASGFEKLQRELADQAKKMSATIVKEFQNAFALLPGQMQAVLDKLNPAKFAKFTGNIGVATNPNNIKEAWKAMKGQTDTIKDQIRSVQKLMQLNFLKHSQDEAAYKSLRKQAVTLDDLLELDDMRTVSHQKYERSQGALLSMEGDMLTLLDASIAKRRLIAGQYQSMLAMQKQLTQQQVLQQRLQQAFGVKNPIVSGTQLKNTVGNFIGRFTSFRGIMTEIGIGIGFLLKYMGEVYRTLRTSGMDAVQTVREFDDVARATWKGWKEGVLAGPNAFAKSLGSLANFMGSLNVPDEAVTATTRLVAQYGVAQEAADKLTSQMTRFAHWSDVAAANGQRIARAVASARNIPIGTMMRDMAKNAELMANYVSRGMEAFARSLATTRQFGVEMSRISGFADNVVDDFESSIMMSAKIQTILPGFNMDEVMYASQFGTDEDVTKALSSALQGSGLQHLDQLPRSLRNMITKSLGLSPTEVENLLGGAKEPGKTEVGADSNYKDTQRAFFNSIGDLTLGNKSLMLVIAAQTTAIIANTGALLSGGGKMLGGVGGMLGQGGRLLGRFAPVAGGVLGGGIDAFSQYQNGMSGGKSLLHGGITGAGAGLGMWGGAAGGAALGSMVPVIGTVIGGIIGGLIGGFGGDWAGGKTADWLVKNGSVSPNGMPSTGTIADGGDAASMYQSSSKSNVADTKGVSVDTTKVEVLLAKLIKAVEAGHVIEIDGREVGKSLLHSYGHG